jgi:hypothetical protein
MDVSLPGGGVELVRRARAGHPDLHIVMFSGHDEASMQEDMLAAGADSYVFKTGRLKPLIAAMDSPPPRSGPAARDVPGLPAEAQARRRHEVFCYRDDQELVPVLAANAAAALANGGRFALVATAEHRAGLRALLPPDSIDRATDEGRFVELDAEQTLATFIRHGVPDPILFDRTVGAAIRSQAAHPGVLHAWGETVSLLWGQGNLVGTLRLEQLWTDLQRKVAFDLVCGYRIADQSGTRGFTAICDLHGDQSQGRELHTRHAG